MVDPRRLPDDEFERRMKQRASIRGKKMMEALVQLEKVGLDRCIVCGNRFSITSVQKKTVRAWCEKCRTVEFVKFRVSKRLLPKKFQ